MQSNQEDNIEDKPIKERRVRERRATVPENDDHAARRYLYLAGICASFISAVD